MDAGKLVDLVYAVEALDPPEGSLAQAVAIEVAMGLLRREGLTVTSPGRIECPACGANYLEAEEKNERLAAAAKGES